LLLVEFTAGLLVEECGGCRLGDMLVRVLFDICLCWFDGDVLCGEMGNGEINGVEEL